MDDVCLSINILVNLCIKVLELALQSGHTVFSGFLLFIILPLMLIVLLCFQ